ncbi:MAG: hypothetical protein VX589_12675 [Myxococcota bacterium]|nr:hypothetical protein [Myxococcota bacterium]
MRALSRHRMRTTGPGIGAPAEQNRSVRYQGIRCDRPDASRAGWLPCVLVGLDCRQLWYGLGFFRVPVVHMEDGELFVGCGWDDDSSTTSGLVVALYKLALLRMPRYCPC